MLELPLLSLFCIGSVHLGINAVGWMYNPLQQDFMSWMCGGETSDGMHASCICTVL